MNYEYDVSVCIPYAEDWPHLYFTVNQCVALLVNSKLSHEIIVVANNCNDRERHRCPKCKEISERKKDSSIEAAAKLIGACDFGAPHHAKLVVSDIPSNGVAANVAVNGLTSLKHDGAQGKYIALMDSHVVLSPDIFEKCIDVLKNTEDAGLVHSPITWTGLPYDVQFNPIPKKRCYQYRYKNYIHLNFHGTYNHAMQSWDPYPIAGCGHGFFMMRREVWDKIGGYHPAQRGYGGREPFLTFKSWLFGYRNFTVPRTNHMHYNGRRLYTWNMDWFLKNCMTQAYSIGGEKWLDIIYATFVAKKGVKGPIIKRLREEAVAESQEQRKFVLDNQKREFDDLFKLWDDTRVYY